MDFVSDWVVGPSQRAVRVINVMDEGSRRALWTEADASISTRTLTEVLDRVVEVRGRPAYVRCDNGPEFVSDRLRSRAKANEVELRFIQPGKPTQNGLIERLNKTLRAECLALSWFTTLDELNDEIRAWSQTYNLQPDAPPSKPQPPDPARTRNRTPTILLFLGSGLGEVYRPTYVGHCR